MPSLSARRNTLIAALTVASLCLAAFAYALLARPQAAVSAQQENYIIRITERGFEPELLSIVPGDTVTWINETSQPVTLGEGFLTKTFLPNIFLSTHLTPSSGPASAAAEAQQAVPLDIGPAAGEFLQVLQPGASFSHTFLITGDFSAFVRERFWFFTRITVVRPAGGQVKGAVYASVRQFDDSSSLDFDKIYLPEISVFLRNFANVEAARVRTDLSGRFSFPHMAAGTYTLCWEADGFHPGCSNQQVVINSKPIHFGEVVISPVREPDRTLVYGRVRLADNSLPRTFEPFADVNAFARVRLLEGGSEIAAVHVNNFGDYLLPQVPVGSEVHLEAVLETETAEYGISDNILRPQSAHRADLWFLNHRPRLGVVLPSANGEYVRVIAPGSTIQVSAEAEDPDGDPVTFHWILPSTSGQLSSQTGANVSWTLPNVEALHRLEVVAYDGRGGYTKSSISVEGTNLGVLFSGQVVDPGGTAVANAAVSVNGSQASTNAAGYFRLHTPQAAEYILNIRKPGYALLSRIYLDGLTSGRWTLTPATVMTFDPTQDIDLRDANEHCLGAISQRVEWSRYPNQRLPRFQNAKGEVVKVGGSIVTFESLQAGSQFAVGAQLSDAGVMMKVEPFFFSSGDIFTGGGVYISREELAGGSGLELGYNNANVSFETPPGTRTIRLRFGEYGGNVNLTINGELANVDDLQDLHGRTVGGARIAVAGTAGEEGILAFEGEIESFSIGGQELFIDEVEFDPIPRLPGRLPCGPGMRVQIPANSLVDANGSPPPGMVQVAVGTYDILSPDGMPGDYSARDSSGDLRVMESFGAGSIEVSDGTTEYNLKPGALVKLSLPPAPVHFEYERPLPATTPNFVYNAETGIWEEEGAWTFDGSEYVTQVGHLSEFNVDIYDGPPACLRIASDTLPPSYQMEVTIPIGEGSAPKVISKVVDNSVPFHVIYNMPANRNVIIMVFLPGGNIPLGTFVANSGAPQSPASPLRPAYPYNACGGEVTLYNPELTDPPSLSQPVANSFLHGLYNFYATSFDEFTGSTPLTSATAAAFAQATADYYAVIDPHSLRDTLAGFIAANNFSAATQVHAVYANSGDLGFGRDMYCTRNQVTPGVFDVACYVSNYGTGYQNYEDGGGYGTPDTTDFENTANQNGIVATVAMEYTRVEDPTNVNAFLNNQRVVKFYVYGATGQRIDGTDSLGNLDVNNAFVDLDGFGGRPLPQLCIVCHGGTINYDGSPSPTNPPVFNSFTDVNMGSVFLPFDLNAFTIVDGLTVGGVTGQYDKANQQAAFRALNQQIVLPTNPGGPIEEVVDYMYPPLGSPGVGNQNENFVVAGWTGSAAHSDMYREVMTPACRVCHLAQVDAPGPVLDTAAEAVAYAGSIRQRVCLDRVMPHARATYDRFWNSIAPHQPSRLIAWGSVFAPGLDWSVCATADPGTAPPIPEVVYHDPQVQGIWTNRCESCHQPGGIFPNPNLTAGNAYGALVGVPAGQLPGMPRVTPFNLGQSYLWHKLNNTQGSVGGSGSQMPLGSTLTATELAIIQQWIEDGALEQE